MSMNGGMRGYGWRPSPVLPGRAHQGAVLELSRFRPRWSRRSPGSCRPQSPSSSSSSFSIHWGPPGLRWAPRSLGGGAVEHPPHLAGPPGEPAVAGSVAASHHGGSGDGILWVRLVPGSEAVDVAAGGQGGPFARHGDVPERGDVGGAGGEGGGGVEVLPIGRARALLHDLLVLGALVLEPDLDLWETEG